MEREKEREIKHRHSLPNIFAVKLIRHFKWNELLFCSTISVNAWLNSNKWAAWNPDMYKAYLQLSSGVSHHLLLRPLWLFYLQDFALFVSSLVLSSSSSSSMFLPLFVPCSSNNNDWIWVEIRKNTLTYEQTYTIKLKCSNGVEREPYLWFYPSFLLAPVAMLAVQLKDTYKLKHTQTHTRLWHPLFTNRTSILWHNLFYSTKFIPSSSTVRDSSTNLS